MAEAQLRSVIKATIDDARRRADQVHAGQMLKLPLIQCVLQRLCVWSLRPSCGQVLLIDPSLPLCGPCRNERAPNSSK